MKFTKRYFNMLAELNQNGFPQRRPNLIWCC